VRVALRQGADAVAEQVATASLIESDRTRILALHRVTAAALT
jgi:hypothetical protein